MSTKSRKRRFRFSTRLLLLAVLLVSLPLAFWDRSAQLLELAAEHHLKAMKNGHQAAEIQRPEPYEWKFPRPLPEPLTDPSTLAQAAPLWRASMQHEEMRDIYLKASRQPWMPLPSKRLDQICAQQSATPESSPSELWEQILKPYIDKNGYMKRPSLGFSPGEKNYSLSKQLLDDEILFLFDEDGFIFIGRIFDGKPRIFGAGDRTVIIY